MVLRFKQTTELRLKICPRDQFNDCWAILHESYSLMAHDYTPEAALSKLMYLLTNEVERLSQCEIKTQHELARWNYLQEVLDFD